MCKLFVVAVALLAVAVYAGHQAPTSEEMESELTAAGLSPAAAEAITAVGEKYKSQIEAAKGDKEAMKKIFDEVKTETDAYIKTASAADQTAYAAFVEKKKAQFESHHSTPAH